MTPIPSLKNSDRIIMNDEGTFDVVSFDTLTTFASNFETEEDARKWIMIEQRAELVKFDIQKHVTGLTRLAIRTGDRSTTNGPYAFTEADDDGGYVTFTDAAEHLAAKDAEIKKTEEAMATLEAAYQTRGEKINDLLSENLSQLEEINTLKSVIYCSSALPDEAPSSFLFKTRRKDGEAPCGECHLKLGETCDICGAKAADA